MTQIQGLYAMVIGTVVILDVWVLSVVASAPMDRFFARHPRIAEFFNWFDEDDDVPKPQSDSEQ